MPKQVDIEEMKSKLLLGSFDLFAKRGLHGTSMRDLAQNLGVSTGTLYHYFPNKNDLFSQMLQFRVEMDIKMALDNLGNVLKPVEKLNKLIDYISLHESYFNKLLYLILDFYRETQKSFLEKNKHIDFLFKKALDYYRTKIEHHLGFTFPKSGEFILSILIGLYIQKIVDPQKISLKAIKDYLVNLDAVQGFKI